jgi:hypothetical protein
MKKYMLVSLLALAPLNLSCNAQTAQAVVEFLPTIVRYIQDAQLILDQIDMAVPPILAQMGQEDITKEYSKRMQQVRSALLVAIRTSKGSQALTQGEIDAAFEEFRVAYRELQTLLQTSGLLVDGVLSSNGGTAVEIPEPLAMGGVK